MIHPYQPCLLPHLENAPLLVFAVQVELSSRQYHPDVLQCLKSKRQRSLFRKEGRKNVHWFKMIQGYLFSLSVLP